MTRREFTRHTAAGAALLGLGDLAFLGRLPPVSAADARLDPRLVRIDSGIEPLVLLLEVTPREKLLEEVAARIKKGLGYQELLAALFLAGVRNLRPDNGHYYHAVLVVHSAHLASLAAPDSERWLPIFWSLDWWKRAQAAGAQRDKGWRLEPVDEARVPSARKARQEFLEAARKGDAPVPEAAVIGMCRSAGAGELFDHFALRGADLSGLGHPAIFVSQAWRTLQTIGWQHAESVLRALARLVLDGPHGDHFRLWQGNRELAARMPAGWQEGKPRPGATADLLAVMRQASPAETSQKVVELLADGVAPQSIWDASFAGVAELLLRQPALPDNWFSAIGPLHAATTLNALRWAYGASSQDETRRFLLLQGTALVPHFRGAPGGKTAMAAGSSGLEPAPITAPGKEAIAEIFATIDDDRGLAARKALGYLLDNGSAQEVIDCGRLLVFRKGQDSHDYKFSSAVFEDYALVSPAWRAHYLASCMSILRGPADKDNVVVERARAVWAGVR
jgi:hypothetical protein